MLSRGCILAIFLSCAAVPVLADDQGDCQAAGGDLRTGTVVSEPVFARGKRLHKVELSHTHFSLKTDQDGQIYDVAVDNVFAEGYDSAGESIPAGLGVIHKGTRLELCGQLYTGGDVGIHWVHTNCGDQPTKADPDGWAKIMNADGSVGSNLEANGEYCRLWPRH